jgi:hypothetical protein
MDILKFDEVKAALTKALLQDGEMSHNLYEYELAKEIGYLKRSLKKDRNDFIICITSNHHTLSDTYHVAMVLIHRIGNIYINEEAKEKLKKLWIADAYQKNLDQLIPMFAESISNNELAIAGVTVDRSTKPKKNSKGFGG